MPDSRWTLGGKSALVTGGTKGIGAAIVAELLSFGATVWLVARREADVRAAVAAYRQQGHTAHGVSADVSTPEGCQRVVAALADAPLDVLVNSVGTNVRRATVDYDDDAFRHVLNTNLYSAFTLSRLLFEPLRRRRGCVVNVASVAGLTHVRTGAPYGASKAALVQLTRNLAVEWAAEGVRVNAVAPWYIRTPLAEQVLADDAYRAEVLGRTPLGRVGEPAEVAAAVAFLALPAAAYVTGQCLAVDGGFLGYGF